MHTLSRSVLSSTYLSLILLSQMIQVAYWHLQHRPEWRRWDLISTFLAMAYVHVLVDKHIQQLLHDPQIQVCSIPVKLWLFSPTTWHTKHANDGSAPHSDIFRFNVAGECIEYNIMIFCGHM